MRSHFRDLLRAGLSGDQIPMGGEIFRTRSYRPWGPHNLLYSEYRVSFPVVKRPGHGVNHPPPYSAEVKGKSSAIPLFLLRPLWPVLR